MGIVRLAKCLRSLKSLIEYKDRQTDINNKIHGERVYMDFVSIVYSTSIRVTDEINYLLYSFILLLLKLLNNEELKSNKLIEMIIKYERYIPRSNDIIKILNNLTINSDMNIDDAFNEVHKIISDISFIDEYLNRVNMNDVKNQIMYENVLFFIVDMLTQKITNVEYILIAFDGIPSFGKIQEQRQRRYMRYAYTEFQKTIGSTKDYYKTAKDKIDIKYARSIYDEKRILIDIRGAIEYIYNQYHNGMLQKDIKTNINQVRNNDNIGETDIIIDVIDRPYGEGEKILMDKLMQDYDKYKNTKSYVFYSPDGDSVILCTHIYIKTKIDNLYVVKTYNLDPSDKHNESSQYVDIKVLYNNIIRCVERLSKRKFTSEQNDDKDNICSDFILLMNMFGNDFIHQIPTLEISTTFIDIMYVYSKYILNNPYLTININSMMKINYDSFGKFVKILASYENMLMYDSVIANIERKGKILGLFGEIFAGRYLFDYKDHVKRIKNDILKNMTNGSKLDYVKKLVDDGINELNKIITVTGKKYGEIWKLVEVKNIDNYAKKIMENRKILSSHYPSYINRLQKKGNNNEYELTEFVKDIESDLYESNKSIDLDAILKSEDNVIRDFSFDYMNIRLLTPHNQMPTTKHDIDLFLLDWRRGKWGTLLNGSYYDIGYNFAMGERKDLQYEIQRYQKNVLGFNKKEMNMMIKDYLKTLSWMVDYYMNTDDGSTSTKISTWSYNYGRSPFLTQISEYITDNEKTKDYMKEMFNDVYESSLVPFDSYIKTDKHKLYIYPQSGETISTIPNKYKQYFPNLQNEVRVIIQKYNSNDTNTKTNTKQFFDCRMCPYFTKCLFDAEHITFDLLNSLNITIADNKLDNRPHTIIPNNITPKNITSNNTIPKNITSNNITPNAEKNDRNKTYGKGYKRNRYQYPRMF